MSGPVDYICFEESDRTWLFDATFLLSSWKCIFGEGCKGIQPTDTAALQQGCCSFGAHFTSDEEIAGVEAYKNRLRADQWELMGVAGRLGWLQPEDSPGLGHTRLHEGACIFLNRPGFEGGSGCALHRAAVEAGERPMDWKPEVCWQVPLRLTESQDPRGHRTVTLREWKRRDWGSGGEDFHWWCTDAPEAFVGAEPVYRYLRDEISALIGTERYERLVAELERRRPLANLPHPAIRIRPVSA